jgi:hypothetical protein
VLDEEVHVDGKIADRLFQPGRVLFTSFESLTAEFPTEVAILARVRGEGNAEIALLLLKYKANANAQDKVCACSRVLYCALFRRSYGAVLFRLY